MWSHGHEPGRQFRPESLPCSLAGSQVKVEAREPGLTCYRRLSLRQGMGWDGVRLRASHLERVSSFPRIVASFQPGCCHYWERAGWLPSPGGPSR
jgi:hypothetical protein